MGVFNFFDYSKKNSRCLGHPDDVPFEGNSDRDSFTRSLGDYYVANRELDLSAKELNKMSITDGAEMWRLFVLFRHKMTQKDPSILEKDDERIDKLARALAEKALATDELYCIYSKSTGEPYLFSETVKLDEGYICTPPDIRFITPAYLPIAKKEYPEETFEFVRISNGDDRKGIERFIVDAIRINGACGFELNSDSAAIDSGFLELDYSLSSLEKADLVNPELMRWMIMMSQIDDIRTEDERIIYNLYFGFFSREIQKATFLVPVKEADGEKIFGYAINPGKYDRQAVAMYTDKTRFNEHYSGWAIREAALSDVIVKHDVVINSTNHPKLGFYIGKQIYEDIKSRAATSQEAGIF